MPKATMASTNRRRNPNSFPDATTRALYRSLCRLKASPQLTTCKVLLESLDRLNNDANNKEQQQLHMIRTNVQETVDSIINSTTSSDDEASSPQRRLALTMELAIQKAFDSSEQGGNNTSAADGEDSSVMSVVQPTRTNNKNSGIVTSPTTTTMQTPSKQQQQQTSLVAAAAAVVSDSSTVASTETREDDDNDSLQLLLSNNKTKKNKFWALLLESLELSISSATTTSKKTRYEVYQLPGVASMNATQQQQLDSVRRSFEQEFLKVFGGNNHDQETCRTYILQQDSTIYLQINIGKWMDYSKVSHNSNTMIRCVVTPDDDYVALTAASRKSSPYVTLVLSALDATLVQHGDRIADVKPHKVGDWCGEEPLELLQAARATRSGQAVGRFVQFASADMVSDPLVEMNKVSTASMLDRTKEQERLLFGAQHGRALAQTAARVERDGATLTAANSNGLIVDSSAVLHNDRKRARDSELGKEGDCPRLEKVCWKWTGETTAAAAAWLSDDEKVQEKGDLPKTKFKCGLTLEGTNVMEGLRQMMAKGYAKAPLPDFVRNAPTVGSSTIVVSDDAFVAEKNSFAAV